MGVAVSALLKLLAGILTGSAGERIGNTVSRAVEVGAVLAAIAPLLLWLRENKAGVFIEITYGDLAFWGPIVGLLVFIIVRLVHRAPPPAPWRGV